MAQKNIKPTESELEILMLLWEQGPSSVRSINERLNEKREVGYTTTLKIMQIMTEKGLVTRDTESRTHIYHPAVRENDTQKSLLKNFIDKTYRGSAMQMVLQALGHQNASPEELKKLKEIINDLEKKK